MSKTTTWSNTTPLTIRREGDGAPLFGFVPVAVTLPASHVHPAVRAAAEAVQQATTARQTLQAELAVRGAQRGVLLADLATMDRTAAAATLREFDSETEILSAAQLPAALQAEREAWENFGHAQGHHREEWNAYLRAQGLAAVDRLREATEVYRAAVAECQHLERLLSRNGVEVSATYNGVREDSSGQEKANWNHARFEHGQRDQTVGTLLGGRDLPGKEGRVLGAVELADQYVGVFAGAKVVAPAPEPTIVDVAAMFYDRYTREGF